MSTDQSTLIARLDQMLVQQLRWIMEPAAQTGREGWIAFWQRRIDRATDRLEASGDLAELIDEDQP